MKYVMIGTMEDNTEYSRNKNLDASLAWKKIERDNKKIGFREGISDGKDINFQKSFDEGYKQGLRNGFLMGKYKGALKLENLQDRETINDEQLQYSRRGLCCLCKDTDLLDKTINEIETVQQKAMNDFSEAFRSKYSNVVLK